MAAIGNPSNGKPLDLTANTNSYSSAANLSKYFRMNKGHELVNDGNDGINMALVGDPTWGYAHPNA